MPRSLVVTREAAADVEEIALWLTQPGAGPVAHRKLALLRRAISRLVDHPCLDPVGKWKGLRELPCEGGYRAVYRAIPDTGDNQTDGDVTVTRVFGPGQDRRRLRR